jgi:hypothetical protein
MIAELPSLYRQTTVTTGTRCEYCSCPRWELLPTLTASAIVDQHYIDRLHAAVNMTTGYSHRFRENEPSRFGGWFQ